MTTTEVFRKDMRALGGGPRSVRRAPAGGRWIMVPKGPEDAVAARRRTLARRRRLLAGMLVAAALTLPLGLVPGLRDVLALHVLIDVALVGYVALLIRVRQRRPASPVYRRVEEEPELLRVGQL